jgi:hypothetical protein
MPDGTAKVTSRWEQVRPYVTGTLGTTILVGVGVGTWLAVAGVFLQNTDGVEVKITNIEKVANTQKTYKFSYTTQGGQMCGSPPIACIEDAFKPCKGDLFTFRNTYTTPTLNDVTALVTDVDESAVYFDLDLTDKGNGTPEWGFMTCHSTFKNQFRGTVRDAVQLVVDTAKDVGSSVLGGFCDVIPIPILCTGFDFSNWTVWACIACLILSFLVGLYIAFTA